MMLFGLFGKKNGNAAIIARQYDLLTQAARRPVLYESMEVPDTVMGRFEMLSAILILYFRRTRSSQISGQEIAQEIIDAFFEDVDHSIRELGVGDVSVPKRMKKLASMFYGRLESYSQALDAVDEPALEAALRRNFHPKAVDDSPSMAVLAAYLLSADAVLSAVDEGLVETGALNVPEPEPEQHSPVWPSASSGPAGGVDDIPRTTP
jgi:cytochrome b pre-mRNA-processing protein 3